MCFPSISSPQDRMKSLPKDADTYHLTHKSIEQLLYFQIYQSL